MAISLPAQPDFPARPTPAGFSFAAADIGYATGYSGLKQMLTIYSLSVDDTLDSIKLTKVSSNHGHAVVKIDYTLLGKPLSTESNLCRAPSRNTIRKVVFRGSH